MAQQLLENPLLQESVSALKADIVAQMEAVALADADAHTRLVMALQITDAVTRHLWRTVQEGVTAEDTIKLRGKRLD